MYNKLEAGEHEFDRVDIFRVYPSLKPHILFYSDVLTICHGFPDIRHNKVNYGRYSAILNLIVLKCFRAYLSLKPHILFYINGIAICHGLSVLTLCAVFFNMRCISVSAHIAL